jgi:hypothetical protein
MTLAAAEPPRRAEANHCKASPLQPLLRNAENFFDPCDPD